MPEETQIEKLANFIMAEIPGEPSRNEGAGDTAIRLLKRYIKLLSAAHRIKTEFPAHREWTDGQIAIDEAIRFLED